MSQQLAPSPTRKGQKPLAGLLPLYIELYDTAVPEARQQMEQFRSVVAHALRSQGIDLVEAPICRLRPEFEAAVRSFEETGADAIVTLHLAYSPSLESAGALASTSLPIIVLDTTPDYSFGPAQHPDAIMGNHGIHGVQDMCNLLIRNGKAFQIEAGHWERSDVLKRVAAWLRSARMASAMRRARVGRIGSQFRGMGDFQVPEDVLRAGIGIEIVPCDAAALRSLLPASNAPEVAAEMEADRNTFEIVDVDEEAHRQTTRTCLAVRKWMEQEKLSAFTMNFMEVDQASGLPTVPFLEASKALARGKGYAGEGDVLTAALVGALGSCYATTFTEMFCPDWERGTVFLSHMGEMNIALAAGKPTLAPKEFPWTDADEPVSSVGRLREGEAVLVNLAPVADDDFALILSPVSMLGVDGEDVLSSTVHGWMRPALPLEDFLRDYSSLGGTHHSALAYEADVEELCGFGEMMGWLVSVLG